MYSNGGSSEPRKLARQRLKLPPSLNTGMITEIWGRMDPDYKQESGRFPANFGLSGVSALKVVEPASGCSQVTITSESK
jgi:hypothetical protein